MTPKQSLKDQVFEAIKVDEPREEISEDTRLETDLNYDDLDRFELSLRLEDIFEIVIDDKEAEEFTTAKDVFEYVENKINEKGGKAE